MPEARSIACALEDEVVVFCDSYVLLHKFSGAIVVTELREREQGAGVKILQNGSCGGSGGEAW